MIDKLNEEIQLLCSMRVSPDVMRIILSCWPEKNVGGKVVEIKPSRE